ncbi:MULTISPECIES: GNAT family N-acetyltransferase [unclassified Rhizobium]|uniref:GNAT family N-acetyltransferase n=1 Tax=unclassified Rhizobium TaxID=2613769 RepID=UPI0006F67142|nr:MULTISPECIES: GNAT family N-acetyltransferase [unclassified Rhizobium]KQV35592.1 acetyltransferase [Rhizobium sp. Root1212]KRD25698.1 acetyltransferase [Rhizobium sp. Root268]
MIEIRNAIPEDVYSLAEIGLAAWSKGIGPLVPAATSSKIESKNPFIPFLSEMGARILVAIVDGRAAGIGACENEDDYISDIWVSPEFEGRGVGSALVRALEREILSRGYPAARIHVAAANERALGLYERLGYKQNVRETAFDPILEIYLEKIGLQKNLLVPDR